MKEDDSKDFSLLQAFDDLTRNQAVLNEGAEQEFYSFVVDAEQNRRRWEQAELESQRLAIELTRAAQEVQMMEQKVQMMEQKLAQARCMLDNEQKARRQAEQERDRVVGLLGGVRDLVEKEGKTDTVEKIRDLTLRHTKHRQELMDTPIVVEKSILEVGDLSFDDTKDLVMDSPLIDEVRGLKRRSRSVGFNDVMEDDKPIIYDEVRGRKRNMGLVSMENKRGRKSRSVEDQIIIKEDDDEAKVRNMNLLSGSVEKKIGRRSRSVGINELVEVRHIENTPRRSSARRYVEEGGYLDNRSRGEGHLVAQQGSHRLVKRTTLKADKCAGCNLRIKFGKLSLRCTECKLSLHSECETRAPTMCSALASPAPITTQFLGSPNLKTGSNTPNKKQSKRQIFASPRLR